MRRQGVRRTGLVLAAGALLCAVGCGGGGGGRSTPIVLTPDSVDFEIDAGAAEDSLQLVEMTFAPTSCAVEEGMVVEAGRRRLLRFDTVVRNLGELDCVIGDPSSPAPGIPPEALHYHECHGHYHLEGYASYHLELPDGTIAAIGHKQSFCILDSIEVIPGASSRGYDCAFQGMSSGWADVYDRGVSGQWVDVTGVPAGDYVLVIHVNPEGVLPEVDDRYANRAEIDVVLPDPSAAVAELDDHADVPAQATTMPSPAGFQATILPAGDADWFRTRLQGGQSYVIRTELVDIADTRLRVFAADGTTLLVENDDVTPGSDLSSRVSLSPTTTDYVTIEVTGPSSATGTYRLIVE